MDRDTQHAFEEQAEILVAHQLDLLAQLERQIRAVHLTLKQIEKLRRPQHRVGAELTNGQRGGVLTALAAELDMIDKELETQHESCADMQRSVNQMRQCLGELRPTTERPARSAGEPIAGA